MNMDVAPMSAIALLVAIEIALRYCWLGKPNNCWAVAAKLWRACGWLGFSMLLLAKLEQFVVVTVTSSSITSNLSDITLLIWVGSKGIAESIFYIYALRSSPPHTVNEVEGIVGLHQVSHMRVKIASYSFFWYHQCFLHVPKTFFLRIRVPIYILSLNAFVEYVLVLYSN